MENYTDAKDLMSKMAFLKKFIDLNFRWSDTKKEWNVYSVNYVIDEYNQDFMTAYKKAIDKFELQLKEYQDTYLLANIDKGFLRAEQLEKTMNDGFDILDKTVKEYGDYVIKDSKPFKNEEDK